MEEKIGKKFLLYFRLALLCWILVANAILHIIGFSYGWLIFISNIMLFTLEGDVKERFLTVEIGGLVGLVLTVLAMLAISALTPIVGDLLQATSGCSSSSSSSARWRSTACAFCS